MVENVDRIMAEENLPPYEATKKAMSGIGSALIAMSLVLCAVFIPVSFLSGITGQLFRQFTITIAVSVIISTIVALTLSPVMCSRLLKPHDANARKNFLFRKINQCQPEALPEDVRPFRRDSRMYLGSVPDSSEELHAAGRPGIFHS